MVPERLDELTGEERHQIYRMLRLQVFVFPNGDLEVRGVLREAVCTPMDTRSFTQDAIGASSTVRRHGALISEYYLGEAPLAWRFPARNRIIAGLAGTVVIVEAPEHSGALITARHALDAGRDVWAVPGPPGVRECRVERAARRRRRRSVGHTGVRRCHSAGA